MVAILIGWMRQQNLDSKFVLNEKYDSFFKINLWNNNNKFTYLLYIVTSLPYYAHIYTNINIECVSTSIYI
jgi:hypothetical protein